MTMWRSKIDDRPGAEKGPLFYAEGYDEWLEEVMAEPWVQALEDMVKWTGLWVGTEEQFFAELEMRVGKEIFFSPDFPSSVERLNIYIEIAIDGFNVRDLTFLHYQEMSPENLEDFDVPEWSPEVPILVFTGRVASRPDYLRAMWEILAYQDALPLAILIFTGEDRHFKNSRRWTGTTTELIDKLMRHSPIVGPVPYYLADRVRPEEKRNRIDVVDFHPHNLLNPITREDYVLFHRQMQKWAGVLKEVRIKVSRQKRLVRWTSPENDKTEQRERTYWTIEAPHWKKPKLW